LLDELRARLNAAVSRMLESRKADDLCRFEDLRLPAIRKEATAEASDQ
jgi:hypothetical protein